MLCLASAALVAAAAHAAAGDVGGNVGSGDVGGKPATASGTGSLSRGFVSLPLSRHRTAGVPSPIRQHSRPASGHRRRLAGCPTVAEMQAGCTAAAAASVGSCLVCVMSKFPKCSLQNFSPETELIDNFCKGAANISPPPPPAAAVLPTGGNVWPVAIYWIYVSVGTPPQRFPVALDSGSMTLDIQGPGCISCPGTAPNRAYNPSMSSTSTACAAAQQPGDSGCCPFSTSGGCLGDTFHNTYQTCDLSDPQATCTISGGNFMDSVSVGGLGPVTATFGAITAQTANFDQVGGAC
eukprot:SAG22_NODE_41_length_25488_cov_6.133719_11_plen_294_part_00